MSGWLSGRRVVVTRPEDQAEGLCSRLRALGAEPVEFPVIAIAPPEPGGPLDQALARLSSYDWLIFTSVNGVDCFWARLEALSAGPVRFPAARVAAIGPATAAALRQRGVWVSLVPDEYRAEAILDEIGDVAGQRILLPRADIARPALADGLRAKGAQVDEAPAYRTVPSAPSAAAFDALRAGVDVITFTSSSTVRNFIAQTAQAAGIISTGDPLIACIGPVTAATARELGLRVDVVAKEYTMEGLVKALDELG